MPVDSTGREIKVGDVITHVNRHGSNMHFHTGVVRKVHEDDGGSIIWQRVNEDYKRGEAGLYVWDENHRLIREYTMAKETQVWRTDYCTITGMTEDELRERHGL